MLKKSTDVYFLSVFAVNSKLLPYGSARKESICNVEDLGSIPGLGRSPGEGKGYPLQYSGLDNSLHCVVHGFTESDMTEEISLSLLRDGCMNVSV